MKVSGPGPIQDPIDILLRVAELNADLLISAGFDDCDLVAPDGSIPILQAKLRRAGIERSMYESCISLLELNEIPDVGQAVTSGAANLEEFLDLRNSRSAEQFRAWIREADTRDARDLERHFVTSLRGPSWVNSLPIRAVRFALVTSAGIVNPLCGTGADLVDRFVQRWLSGFSPGIFLDSLRSLCDSDDAD